MADEKDNKLDLNSAESNHLTQLPGVSIDIARKIVNWRKQHGLFTAFEELRRVPGLPEEAIEKIRERAFFGGLTPEMAPPRHLENMENNALKGKSKDLRNTRRQKKLGDAA